MELYDEFKKIYGNKDWFHFLVKCQGFFTTESPQRERLHGLFTPENLFLNNILDTTFPRFLLDYQKHNPPTLNKGWGTKNVSYFIHRYRTKDNLQCCYYNR